MSPIGLKFSQMILHTETSKLMYNWSFLFVVLHNAWTQWVTLLKRSSNGGNLHENVEKEFKWLTTNDRIAWGGED